VHIGTYEFFGSERLESSAVEDYLIPKLVRVYGEHHRSVHRAKRRVEDLLFAEADSMEEGIEGLSWGLGELGASARREGDRDHRVLDDPPDDGASHQTTG
jgi:hypothetical protein